VSLIHDCLTENLTLDQLSMETQLSPWHFLRAFRQVFGETPHAYLTRLRLARARDGYRLAPGVERTG
jgi:AraC family transcriptional regulator